ncbi:MAG: hypothetical protein GY841_12530 [FCB group bacterium]|nr:hypothetical protein [FCB group bacterium]
MSGSLVETCQVTPALFPTQTVSSVAATDVITLNKYQKVTFVVGVGTVTTGGNISVRQMDSVGDTVASESRVDVDYVYENAGGASDTYTRRAGDSISSYGGCTVANADDSAIFLFEVRASQLASSNDCVALYFDSSTWNTTLVTVTAILSDARYKQKVMPTALA